MKSHSSSVLNIASPRNLRGLKAKPKALRDPEVRGIYGSYAYFRLLEVGMSESNALLLSREMNLISYNSGERIWNKGACIDAWVFIVSGMVAACHQPSRQVYEPVEIYSDSVWFGEHHILNGACAEANYVCLLRTDVIRIPSAKVLKLLHTEPEYARFMSNLIALRCQATFDHLTAIKIGNPCFRTVAGVWRVVLAVSGGFENARQDARQDVTIPLKQEVLAMLCGVSRSLFSRFLALLADAGWLRPSYGSLTVIHLVVWSRVADLHRLRATDNYSPSIADVLDDFALLAVA